MFALGVNADLRISLFIATDAPESQAKKKKG
jgi:hypothetical protein